MNSSEEGMKYGRRRIRDNGYLIFEDAKVVGLLWQWF